MRLSRIKLFRRRGIILLILFYTIFTVLCFRINIIQDSVYSETVNNQSTRSVFTSSTRGYIYDRNGIPLVNDSIEEFYYVLKTDSTKDIIREYSQNNEAENVILVKIDGDNHINESDYIKKVQSISRYSDNMLCEHIIGYTDVDGYGVCGIEKAFDRILDEGKGYFKLSCTVNAKGKAFAGDGFKILQENFNSPAGIMLTIDKRIQQIVEDELEQSDIITGAVVVMDVSSGEILASASVPKYDINNLEASLNDKNLPFLNRAFAAYPVGSVIKPFIAASALKNNIKLNTEYECSGHVNVSGTVFRCYNANEHGKEDLNKAIENSCNCYFIDMGIKVGNKKIINCLNKFGFGNDISFCSALHSASGNVPDINRLKSEADTANLCFGQGEFMATPVQIAAAYSVIANGGTYNEPYLLRKLINNRGEVYGYYKSENTEKILDKEYCDVISVCLYNNMLNGTGINGLPDNVSAAGKTATAQTGKYNESGAERLCTWFAGFFPFENPRYTVVVFNENGVGASVDCAPVFKRVAERIVTDELNR